MKQLLLMRHAKSSWDEPGLSDHDRPLNRRGERDAPRMGRLLQRCSMEPDRIVSSTAERAITTARLAALELDLSDRIDEDPDLYHASVETLRAIIRAIPDEPRTVLIVAHNPGLEDLVSTLSGAWHRFPTCALAHFRLPASSWDEFDPSAGAQLVDLWCPRDLEDESAA